MSVHSHCAVIGTHAYTHIRAQQMLCGAHKRECDGDGGGKGEGDKDNENEERERGGGRGEGGR